MKRGAVWGLLFLAISACATKKASAPTERKSEASRFAPTPPDLEANIKRSVEFGRALYLVDKASSIGTDVLLANVKAPQDRDLAGYITQRDTNENGELLPAFTVLFYSNGDSPVVKYRIHIPIDAVKRPVFEAVQPPTRVQEGTLMLVHARAAAVKAAGPFTQLINPVILPAGDFGEPGDLLVELLAGTKKTNTVVFGKHFRVIVSGDGLRVKSVTPLSKRAIEMPAPRDEKGREVEALILNQVLTDYPVETHVLVSMQSKLPVFVATSRGNWMVDQDSIHLMAKDN
jgi:hypothetical protein